MSSIERSASRSARRGAGPAARTGVAAPVAWLVCIGALAGGAALALQHPVSPPIALAAFLAWVAMAHASRDRWPGLLPAVVPLLGFASWTGSIIVEEADLCALGVVAAAYGLMARRQAAGVAATGWSTGATVLTSAFTVAGALALYRAFALAGPIDPGLLQSYNGGLNGLRVFKPYLLALGLVPPLLDTLRRDPRRATRAFAAGLAAAAALTALTVVWERMAFPGLLNFTTDYRATGLFWEMHVGGAALDGVLALAIPFAVRTAVRAHGRLRAAAAGAIVLLVAYAYLATFSRGLYVAVPVSLAVLAILLQTSVRTIDVRKLPLAPTLGMLAAMPIAAGLCMLAFMTGGYRALAAAFVVGAVSLPLSHAGPLPLSTGIVSAAVGAAVAVFLGVVVAPWIPKGAYWLFGLAALGSALALAHALRARDARSRALAWTAFAWLTIAAVGVALTWGGLVAARNVVPLLLVITLAAVWRAGRVQHGLAVPWRAYLAALGAGAMVAAIVAVFVGGGYMSGRFSSGESDLAKRTHHWSQSLSMLSGPVDWLLGRGLGRFPADYFFNVPDGSFPGSYRIDTTAESGAVLVLSGPRAPAGFGELFRISQRVRPDPGRYRLRIDVRAQQDVELHSEVCEKHLLYSANCAIAVSAIKASAGWQSVQVELDGSKLSPGPWYAPRLGFFSLAVDSPGRRIDVARVALTDDAGRERLVNGDFARGMQRWFFTSDTYHLPWHIESLPLAVLFDEGLAGLALFTLLVATALWRVTGGRARRHPVAPYLAASLVAFLLVGALASLIDDARVALMFYLVLFFALALPATDTGS